jgi:hypothetical protein
MPETIQFYQISRLAMKNPAEETPHLKKESLSSS